MALESPWMPNPYHRGVVPIKKVRYPAFDPYKHMGDHVTVTSEASRNEVQDMLYEARKVLIDHMKTVIPYDFAKFIKIKVQENCDPADPFRHRLIVRWDYYPPSKALIDEILNCAAHRYVAKQLEREARHIELQKFISSCLQGVKLPSPPTLPQFPEELEWQKYVRSPLEIEMIKEQAKALRGINEHKAIQKIKKKG